MATPTNVIEIPTATIVGDECWNVGADVSYDWTAQTTSVVGGVTYGFSEDFELGFDFNNRFQNDVYANLKWRFTDEDKDDSIAVGIMDLGFQGNSPNMLYAMATFQGDDDDDFRGHVGFYYGDNTFLAGDNFNLMLGCDFGDDEWRGYVDYIAGNNRRGVFSIGVGYTDEDGEWSGKIGYQHWNQSGDHGLFAQVDYLTD